MVATAAPRKFVPKDLDVADVWQIEALYKGLIDRPIASADELRQWLQDFSELRAVVDEYGSRRYIDKSCHTEDEAIKKRYLHFVEEVDPKIKPLFFQLQKKYLESPFRPELKQTGLDILQRKWKADVELFRDENIPLETQATKLVTNYDEIMGKMMVPFRGKEYTPQQMGKFIEEPDRPTRQEAWEATTKRRLQDREAIEEVYDKLLPIRQSIAKNAGLPDYRAFVWKAYKRFDYTPEDCIRFGDAIAQTCVPLVAQLDEQRKQDLKLEK